MARQTLPDSVEKRNILHGGKTTPATLVSVGELFERAGRHIDAFEFFAKARHEAGVQRVLAYALEAGQPLLLYRLRRSGLREVSAGDWARAAEAAEKAGRFQDALTCLQEAGENEKLEALREKLRSSPASSNGTPPAAPPKPPI